MKKESKLLPHCKKAKLYCHKCQYDEASWLEYLKLKVHLLFCGNCRKFSKRNRGLTSLVKKAKLESLTASEILYLEKCINDNLPKKPNQK